MVNIQMMGKLQATTLPSSDAKEVIISTTEACSHEPPEIKVVRINTCGPEATALDADQAICTHKSDNDKRRSVRLERPKLGASWGFTLQSYGIYNGTKRSIENYTFVDYVEVKSPAYLSGMKRGDIIFAVDGQSTDDLSHEDLVDRIKVCKSTMRMVLVHSNICKKVELHQRRQKLQALLRQKQSELSGLEKREIALHINAKSRAQQQEMRRKKILAAEQQEQTIPAENHYCSTLLVTENNNTVRTKMPVEADERFMDARPKLSPVNYSIDSRLPTSTQIKLSSTPSQSTMVKSKNSSPPTSTDKKSRTKARLKSSPTHKLDTKRGHSSDKESRLRAGISKLAINDEPTAYERTLFAHSRKHEPPNSLHLRQAMDSQMYRSVRLPKSPTAADPMYRSLRGTKSPDSKVAPD